MFIYRLQKQTRDIGFTIIESGLFRKAKVKDSDIESYFEKALKTSVFRKNFRELSEISRKSCWKS